jgi:hypothetical protein
MIQVTHNLAREIKALRELQDDMRAYAIINALAKVSSRTNQRMKEISPVRTGALRRSWGVGRALSPREGEIRTWVKVRGNFEYKGKKPVFYAEVVNRRHGNLFDTEFQRIGQTAPSEIMQELRAYIARYKRR